MLRGRYSEDLPSTGSNAQSLAAIPACGVAQRPSAPPGCAHAVGLVWFGLRIARGGHESPVQVCRSNQPALHVEPALRLAGAFIDFITLFRGVGLFLAIGTRFWPHRMRWFCPRFICFWTVLPALMVASPRIYAAAWVALAVGVASILARLLERHVTGLGRWLFRTFPALVAAVFFLATLVVGVDWLKEWREVGRPLPPVDSPNVLLVVMDTVRADHLSVYGYERPTTPVLERLARRGIRFDNARATAPWTLPSHASFFSGRWPHELGAEWLTPLRGNFPMLSEYLGSNGYATAGFVANTLYCSHETGLDRGFTHYEDYVLEGLMPLRTAWLFDHAMQIISDWGVYVGRTFDVGPFRPLQGSWFASLFVVNGRKDAGSINRGFVNWLLQRREPARPFFAFLNFFDAHAHYVLPRGAEYRFGLKPRRTADFVFLIEYWDSVDKLSLRPVYRRLAQDSYDNCIAYLDERLGELFDELQKRGLLDQTLVIVTADHGEGLGDHDLFDHGESLYRNEIRVPLLIVLPARSQSQAVVGDTVSLRDLPATIVDLIGLGDGAPFPGRSLALPCGRDSARRTDTDAAERSGSRNSRSPIRSIRIMAAPRLIEDRSSPWPKATSSISATRETEPRKSSMNATIPASCAILPMTRRCSPAWNVFAGVLTG